MASDLSFAEYVADQCSGAGRMTCRKMFGEFALYCDGKVVALICDNQVFVKPTPAGRTLLGAVTEAAPFPGAKPHLLMRGELDDPDLMATLIRQTACHLPEPRPRPPKKRAPAKRRSADS